MLMGAHVALLVRAPSTPAVLLTIVLISSYMALLSFGAGPESEILIKFKESLENATAVNNWNPSTSPCSGEKANWIGVICFNGSIWGLQLENMGLTGVIDIDSLVPLPYLRTLSFMNNGFNGPMPDLKKLVGLKTVYLSNNYFSGEIADDAFFGMVYLKKVFLVNNEFTGKIPLSLAALPRLLELRLEENGFEGKIPDFQQEGLQLVNVSNNDLEGPIPTSLSKMSSSSFSGNNDLCGQPLEACNSSKIHFPTNAGNKDPCVQPLEACNSSKGPSVLVIVFIVIAIGLTLAAIVFIFIIFHCNKKQSQLDRNASLSNNQNKSATSPRSQAEPRSSTSQEYGKNSKKAEQGKLLFVRDDRERFDLQDLLSAAAEVLGSGSFGSSYKTVLLNGDAMVVKRYKQLNNVGREEFHEHMRRLGRLRHPNLLPLVAYYYRKEEKLLVYDFVENGSLASHLHGTQTAELDWPTRLNIINGIVKGLAYLYSEIPSLIVPHGHLKSSNVLLDESFKPLLTDYALMPMINLDHAQQLMVAYKSPEYARYGRTTKKTDIWSLGVLILEVLTGRIPANYLTHGYSSGHSDLASWVSLVAREEWTNEVFDKEMSGTKDGEGEIIKLLKIGLACCEEDVEIRWDLKEVVEKILEVKERDNEEGNYISSYASEGGVHSFRSEAEDDF